MSEFNKKILITKKYTSLRSLIGVRLLTEILVGRFVIRRGKFVSDIHRFLHKDRKIPSGWWMGSDLPSSRSQGRTPFFTNQEGVSTIL